MNQFTQDEIERLIWELHEGEGVEPALMTAYARTSGHIAWCASFFNPFQYEREARAVASCFSHSGPVLAIVQPDDRYAVRFYALRVNEGRASIPFQRRRARRLPFTHHGFAGIKEPSMALEYQSNQEARLLFEKALSLLAATALYRALGESQSGLYFMEKGWSTAIRLS